MDKSKFLSFDIEVDQFDPTRRFEEQLPHIGIICAACASRDWRKEIVYATWEGDPVLTNKQARDIVKYLLSWTEGYVVTVNGIGFDLPILAKQSGMGLEVADIALNHVDFLYQVVCSKGWRVGLDAFADGSGIKGKAKEVTLADGTLLRGMSGGLAPKLWEMGETEAVMYYLKEDVRVTLEIAEITDKNSQLVWRSKSGKLQGLYTDIKTVKECRMFYPIPDQSWMNTSFGERPNRNVMLKWVDDLLKEHD